jgi:hypothetical protein
VSAEKLLDEARRAITGEDAEAASLWLDLARTELDAFRLDAARDATRAFNLASAAGLPDIQAAAIDIVVRAGRVADARRLARAGTGECAALFAPIVPAVEANDAIALARACRDRDRTYPYHAVALRAYAAPAGSPDRTRLVDQAIESLVFETTPVGRNAGMAFVAQAAACSMLTGDQVLRVQGHVRQTAPLVTTTDRAECRLSDRAAGIASDVSRVAAVSTAIETPDDLALAIQTARGESSMGTKVRALLAIVGELLKADR